MSTSGVDLSATPSTIISTAPTSSASSPNGIENQVLVGAIVGGTVGLVILVLVIGVMVWCARRRRKAPEILDRKLRDSTTSESSYVPRHADKRSSMSSIPPKSPPKDSWSYASPRKHSNPFTEEDVTVGSVHVHATSDASPMDSETTLTSNGTHEIPWEISRSNTPATNVDMEVDLDEFPTPPSSAAFQTSAAWQR